MHQETPGNSSNFGKNLNPEQFDQLVEAILAGKYSWACVLMLRFAGYNPLHYIPYRTYNRLIKENSQVGRANSSRPDNMKIAHLPTEKRVEKSLPSSCLGKLKDLAYLEVVGKQKKEIRGGNLQNNLQPFLTSQGEEPQPFKAKTETTQDLSLFCDFN